MARQPTLKKKKEKNSSPFPKKKKTRPWHNEPFMG
jgi:hypothetical protein